jgi:hypothetical protein
MDGLLYLREPERPWRISPESDVGRKQNQKVRLINRIL